MIWHGTNPWGEPSQDCQGWSTDNPMALGLASDIAKDGDASILSQRKVPCNHQLIVLCIETTKSHTIFSTAR